MTEDDRDLKEMFAAQRETDIGLVPIFDDIAGNSPTGHVSPAAPVGRKAIPAAMVLSGVAVTLVVAVCLMTWINVPSSEDRTVGSTSQADLKRINELCDSLVHTIETIDQPASNEQWPDQEMQWPIGTDSLLVTRHSVVVSQTR